MKKIIFVMLLMCSTSIWATTLNYNQGKLQYAFYNLDVSGTKYTGSALSFGGTVAIQKQLYFAVDYSLINLSSGITGNASLLGVGYAIPVQADMNIDLEVGSSNLYLSTATASSSSSGTYFSVGVRKAISEKYEATLTVTTSQSSGSSSTAYSGTFTQKVGEKTHVGIGFSSASTATAYGVGVVFDF